MFSDLFDNVFLIFSWRWPKAEGVITAIDLQHIYDEVSGTERPRIVIVYKFSVGDDGPYTGESAWPRLEQMDLMNINEVLKPGRPVTVRYRKDNPSVNRLDRSVWQDLDGL